MCHAHFCLYLLMNVYVIPFPTYCGWRNSQQAYKWIYWSSVNLAYFWKVPRSGIAGS